MIKIEGVTFCYHKNKAALEGVTWSLGDGIYGLLGPNGAGKTTLLRILAALAQPAAGQVWIGGVPLSKPDEARKLLGYLPQQFELPEQLTPAALLDYVAAIKGFRHKSARQQETERLLHSLHLEQAAQLRIGALSNGMKQRLGLAQAMIGEPPVLIVDEPTVGLDPEERLRLRHVLAVYSSQPGRTVLLSTHLLADVESICTGLAVLKNGKLAAEGSAELIAAYAQGRVWQLELSEREFERLEPYRLVHASRTKDGFQCRLLSGQCPGVGAVPVEPTLEDGYMVLAGEGLSL